MTPRPSAEPSRMLQPIAHESQVVVVHVSGVSRLEDASLSYSSLRGWEEQGPIDGLVYNAGIIRRDDAVDFTDKTTELPIEKVQLVIFAIQVALVWVLARRTFAVMEEESPR